MTEVAAIAIATALLAAIGLAIFHKIRRVHLMQYAVAEDAALARREAQALYGQIESLLALNKLLRLDAPLPPLRGWAGSPDFLLTLAQHVLSSHPARILECSSGASTIVLARSVQLVGRGHVESLEHDPRYAERTRAELRKHNLERWATVVDAPLAACRDYATEWYSVAALPSNGGSVDMLVIDGPPADRMPLARMPALPVLMPMLTPDCAVFLDDADRPGERAIVTEWLRRFPHLDAEALPCEKGCVRLVARTPAPPIDAATSP